MTAATGPAERRPRALGRDEAVGLDGEIVVWREHGIHRLNATAALVWSRCDGVTDLATIVRGLSSEFRAAEAIVREDVLVAVEELAARGLVTERVEPIQIPMIDPPIECTGCGDGPRFDARVLVAVDGGLLAVGADAAFAPELAAALGDRAMGVLRDGGRTSYGVVLPEPAAGPRQDVACLFRGPDLLARSRHPEPVVAALIAQIGAHAVPAGRVLLDALAVGRAGLVALVAPPANAVAFGRRAAAAGLAIAPGHAVVLEPSGADVTTGAPWLGVDFDRLRLAVRDRVHAGTPLVTLPAGDHRVAALGASAPNAARAFGELAPARSFEVGDAPLRLVRALGDVVPVLAADDLAAIRAVTVEARAD